MRQARVLVLLAACGDATGTSAGGMSTDTTGTTAFVPTTNGLDSSDTSAVTSNTTAIPDLPPKDPLVEYVPCPDGTCPTGGVCVQLGGASICGPSCPEYGPGSAAGRCPNPEVLSTICPYNFMDPAPCILGCATAADCPDEGMVCLPCEPPYADACASLNNFIGFEGSASMCAWPNP